MGGQKSGLQDPGLDSGRIWLWEKPLNPFGVGWTREWWGGPQPSSQEDGGNNEIMSGKLFELLRNTKLQRHKVLLHPSPHQPRTPQLRLLQKPSHSPHMKGLADPRASHPHPAPADSPKIQWIRGVVIWLERMSAVGVVFHLKVTDSWYWRGFQQECLRA